MPKPEPTIQTVIDHLRKIDQRLEKQDKRFEKQDKRFDHLDDLIDNLAIITKNGFEAVDNRFEQMELEIEKAKTELKAQIDHVKYDSHADYRRIQEQLTTINTRLDRLEARMEMALGDQTAYAQDIQTLRRHVAMLQKQVRELQATK